MEWEDLGERRKTPSQGALMDTGVKAFWLEERYPPVPEAMEEGGSISFHKSGTAEKEGTAKREREEWSSKTY